MADWSALPQELLYLICQQLPTTDVIRFRSVCAAWRASVRPESASYTLFPIIPNSGIFDPAWGFHLSERTIYSLQSPFPNTINSSWIIKIERDNPVQMHLLDPLASSQFMPLPGNFPKRFSFIDIKVREIIKEYVLRFLSASPMLNSIGDLYGEKVAVMKNRSGEFAMMTIHVSGKLAVCESSDKKWRLLRDDLGLLFEDVIFKHGKFYAVDHTGRAIVMDSVDFNVTPVADSIFGGDRKFLVDCYGELLLVDKYLTGGLWVVDEDVDDSDSEFLPGGRAIKFQVWKLNENQGKWEQITDLGDHTLFLGENSSFAANSQTLGDGCWKNCICFMDGIYSLERLKIERINETMVKKFWPPPNWVYTAASAEEETTEAEIMEKVKNFTVSS